MVITDTAVREVLSCLPAHTFTRRYTAHVEKRSESHIGYQTLCALSLLTQTAPSSLSLSYGTDLYANELFLLIGPSGAGRKGTAVQTARRILSDGDFGLEGAFPNAVTHGDIASDEGLQDQIARQPRFLVAIEEFGDFLQKTAAPQHARIRLSFNKLFDCTPAGRLRAEGKNRTRTESMKSPRGTTITASTPDYLTDYTRRTDWTGGFMSRWFTLYPEDLRTLEPPPQPDLSELRTLIKDLQGKERRGLPKALRCAGRTEAGARVWAQWTKGTRETVKGLKNEVFKAVLQRMETHALKVAMLLAWDLGECSVDNWLLSSRALVPAIRLTNLHAYSLCRMIGLIPANDEAAERARILKLIPDDGGRISRATVLNHADVSAKKLDGHVVTLLQAQLINIVGDDVEGTISYARKPGMRAKSDSFADLALWDPPLSIAEEDANAEIDAAMIKLVEGTTQAVLDEVALEDIIL